MRLAFLSAALVAIGLTACSKKPQPAVTPTPEPPTRTEPAPPPPPPPAPAGPACDMVIASMVSELGTMINFDTDRFEVRPDAAGILDRKAEVLRSHPAVRLRITGHADERYTDEYNLVLGTRRAEAAKDYLVRRGVDASRMETASLGETQPLDRAGTEEAWAKNRRDEFTVLSGRETLASHIAGCR